MRTSRALLGLEAYIQPLTLYGEVTTNQGPAKTTRYPVEELNSYASVTDTCPAHSLSPRAR